MADGDFMMRPTEVFVSYLAAETGRTEVELRRHLRWGRIAMALEVLTVVRLLEDHQLMAEGEGMISCLLSLLQDQDLAAQATAWYEILSEWRKPKLYAVGDASSVGREQPSALGVPPTAQPPHGSNGAQPDSGQTTDPPSSE